MKQLSILFILFSVMFGCSPSRGDLALKLYNSSAVGDSLTAIEKLDSVIVYFSDQTILVEKAIEDRHAIYRDKVLKVKGRIDISDSLVAKLKSGFSFKESEYGEFGTYEQKRQRNSNSWDRSFIKVNLTEKGDIYLSSNYYGDKWLDHTKIRVYDGDDDAKSVEVSLDHLDNRHSDFMDLFWEKVSYRNGGSDSIIEFIVANRERNLKCVFIGKKYHYIILEKYDKDAVVSAYDLSKALKENIALKKELESLRKLMNRY